MKKNIINLILIILVIINVSQSSSKVPFIDSDQVYESNGQFQVNLIINQNKNVPIIIISFNNDKLIQSSKQILKNAFYQEPGLCFGLLIDCSKFRLDLNGTLGFCQSNKIFQTKQNEDDTIVSFYFLTPSVSRIVQKGHILLKNHDIKQIPVQQLTSTKIAKLIRSQLPDFINYIEDEYDLRQFLQMQEISTKSKQPKILLFHLNLLSPFYLRKLSSKLDRQVKFGVCDDSKIAKLYNVEFDDLILLEYNFQKKEYQHKKIQLNENNPFLNVIESLDKYLSLGKSRDILLDFEHKQNKIYNISTSKYINTLLSHGRIVLLQISQLQNQFKCQKLKKQLKKYQTLFNYVCFDRKSLDQIKHVVPFFIQNQNYQAHILMIQQSIKQSKMIKFSSQSLINFLTHLYSRQIVSNNDQAELCIRTAESTQRDAIFYYLNQKSFLQQIQLIEYLNSLPQINKLIFFCKVYLPNTDLIKSFSLKQNSIFTMLKTNQKNHAQKVQQKDPRGFLTIKMFLRQIAILRMNQIYQNKLIKNKVLKIDSPQMFSRYCFTNNCIIGLIATNKYRTQKQIEVLQQISLTNNQQNYKFIWIDGICHFQIPKQLKILKKNQKIIDRSYVFLYKEKGNVFSLWISQKVWNKKQLAKWIKNIKKGQKITSLKYGLDIEDKVCDDNSNKNINQL